MANIILNTDDLTLTIEERGETNTVSNVGSGAGVFKEKTGSDLRLRSIGGGAHVTTTENTDDITIDVVWDQSIVPTADESYDLGSTANKFKELYTKDFTIVDANDRGEIASPRGVYWQSTAGNIEVDSTANDIVLRTDASNKVHIINNLTIDGDLDVNGNLTTIDTVNLQVEDAIIELNRGGDLRDSGLIINRTGVDNAVFYWDDLNTEFRMVTADVSSLSTEITSAGAWADLAVGNLAVSRDLSVYQTLSVYGTSNLQDVNLSGGLDMNSNNISEVNNLTVTGLSSLADVSLSGALDMNSNSISGVNDLSASGIITIGTTNVNGLLNMNGHSIRTIFALRGNNDTMDIGTVYDHDMLTLSESAGVTANATLSTTANLSVGTWANIQGNLYMHGQNIDDVDTLSANAIESTNSSSITFGAPTSLLSVEVGATLPASPISGERFIHNGVMKIYTDSTWNDYDPADGSMVYDSTNNRTLVRENGAWRAITTTAL